MLYPNPSSFDEMPDFIILATLIHTTRQMAAEYHRGCVKLDAWEGSYEGEQFIDPLAYAANEWEALGLGSEGTNQ